MPLFVLIALTMCAFAANSVLSRAAIDVFGMDPMGFSGLRVASGAVMLAGLLAVRGGGWPRMTRGRAVSTLWMLVYLVPFSLAYLTLPSGVGALILFGVVQLTMFAGAAVFGVRPGLRQWAGMGVAMCGLGWLLWPGAGATLNVAGVVYMMVAGIGWGLFSLSGRGAKAPLVDMTVSFVALLPVAIWLMVIGTGWSINGVLTAVVCGALTSGVGYALWYSVLPCVAATTAAVAQLSVPVIALAVGSVVLREAITLDIVLASAIVLGGIALSVRRRG